ncbi:MAG TPA: IPT/TIG domain-containing protein, partial [Candidatus Thermoplasmatota archaeon]|nr:IPT/TIG domain-containing protein [Candidatus Thermoplasmatota archaeon]
MSRATHIAIAAFLVLGSLAVAPSANAAPAIGNVSPSSGPTNGGTPLNITGTGFVAGATVQLFPASNPTDAVTLTNTQASPTVIRGITPPRSGAGTLQVRVVNPDGSSAVAGTSFTYTSAAPPSLDSFTPASGPSNGGTTLIIRGSGFSTAIKPSVRIDTGAQGSYATVQSVNATTIVAITAAGDGDGVVTVTNPDGTEDASEQPYTFLPEAAPTLTDITPRTGPANGGTKVTVSGTNLAPGATVQFGGEPALSVGFVSPTQL